MRDALVDIPEIAFAKMIRDEIVRRGKAKIGEHGERVGEDIAVAVIERDAKYLAVPLAEQIGHQVGHAEAPVTKPVHPDHLAPKARRMDGQAAQTRATRGRHVDLVVHEHGDRHGVQWRSALW